MAFAEAAPEGECGNDRLGALGNQAASVTLADGKAGVMIDFDVAVTVTEKAEKEGGAAISVAGVFGLGGKASAASETSSISRIKFSVPIVYPVS